eukprot:COSAG03_NODE_1309_length_4346_cov_3.897339_2_plen_115_part_00
MHCPEIGRSDTHTVRKDSGTGLWKYYATSGTRTPVCSVTLVVMPPGTGRHATPNRPARQLPTVTARPSRYATPLLLGKRRGTNDNVFIWQELETRGSRRTALVNLLHSTDGGGH